MILCAICSASKGKRQTLLFYSTLFTLFTVSKQAVVVVVVVLQVDSKLDP